MTKAAKHRRRPAQARPTTQSVAAPSPPADDVVVDARPPMWPHRKAFVLLAVLLALWIAFLLSMWWTATPRDGHPLPATLPLQAPQ